MTLFFTDKWIPGQVDNYRMYFIIAGRVNYRKAPKKLGPSHVYKLDRSLPPYARDTPLLRLGSGIFRRGQEYWSSHLHYIPSFL